MTIEFDDLDKDWDARAHTPDEYRQEIRALRERCVVYVQELGSVHAELTELRKQKERGRLTFTVHGAVSTTTRRRSIPPF